MKKLLVSVAALFALAGGTAQATSLASLNYRGIHCETNPKVSAVVCFPMNGTGYAVSISRTSIVVVNGRGKLVFGRTQP